MTGRPALSPYLNLLNGNVPAVNYYYGVRPLLQNPGYGQGQGQMTPPISRGAFFQPNATSGPAVRDEFEPDDTKKFRLPSPGGPVSYGNSFGSSRAGLPSGASNFTRPPVGGIGGAAAGGGKAPAAIPKTK